jgi:uncharacterized SAM-binding protein YcdF (DUF218 family)
MYEFLVEILQPYFLLYLLTGLAILNLWHRRRESRRRLILLSVAFLALTAMSIPAVAHLAMGTLEWQYEPADDRPEEAGAIVVLACGVIPPGPGGQRGELGTDTVRRCRHAAALYHQGRPCPVVVSGGQVRPDSPEPAGAPLMRDFLVEQGVRPADLIVEDRSRTTYENAVECCRILRDKGVERPLLVADAVDLFRAERCFRKQGVEVVPSASDYGTANFEWSYLAFLPRPGAARLCQRVWHEWLGTLWYSLRGRI